MNKKLSIIILFLLLISLISVLLAFIAFSKNGNNGDIGQLKTGYEQLSKQVNELKATTEELESKTNGQPVTPKENPEGADNTPKTNENSANNKVIEQEPQNQEPVSKTISGSSVNLRSSASTTGNVVRQLPQGEKITVLGNPTNSGGYQWFQIQDSKGNTGWVVSSYVK